MYLRLDSVREVGVRVFTKAMRTGTSPAHPLVRLPGQGAEAVVVALLLLLLLLPTLRRVLKFATT